MTRPGSFAYKEGLNLVDLLMRAGGVTRYASVEQIRVIGSGTPAIFNLKDYLMPVIVLATGGRKGTTLFVPKQEEIKMGAHAVYVMGEVFKPGAYESKPGVTFLTFWWPGGPRCRVVKSVSLSMMAKSFPLTWRPIPKALAVIPAVEPGDSIFVPEKTDLMRNQLKVSPKRAVHVGELDDLAEWNGLTKSLMDLLAHVGGPTAKTPPPSRFCRKTQTGSCAASCLIWTRISSRMGVTKTYP